MPTTIRPLWVWLLSLSPVLVALLLTGPGDYAGPGAWLNLLGRLTGIAGLSLLLVATLLCCRVPGFDVPFGGLTKLWRLHHKLGAAGFLCLLAHPLLLAFAAADVSMAAAISTLFNASAALWLGWAALLLMMIFLAPSFSFFGAPDYQRWKHLHRLSTPAVILALAHTALATRSVPGLWGWLIWGSLFALALFALGYRVVYARLKGRNPYRIDRVDHVANNVVELVLSPLDKGLAHVAGQFVYLTPFDKTLANGYREEHPYTISSAPGDAHLRIAIKDLGDASRAIQTVTPGTDVALEGPYGDFFPRHEEGEPELWIAGGIGITPFLGRLRHLARTGARADTVLIYCVQDESRAIFLDEIEQLLDGIEGAELAMHYFYHEGPLNQSFVEARAGDYLERSAYICGPLPLIDCAKHLLYQGGMSEHNITTEEFVRL